MPTRFNNTTVIRYPEFYYSKHVEEVLNSTPKLPDPPASPQEPSKPIDPGNYDDGGNAGCFTFALIAEIIGVIAVISSDLDNKFGIILALLGIILISVFLLKTESWDKESNKAKKQKYEEDLRQYPRALSEYQNKLWEYQRQKKEYDRKVEESLSVSSLTSYRKRLINNWERQRESVTLYPCKEDEIVKKGVAEDYFVIHLRQKGFSVLTDQKIPVGSKFYYPDIIITDGGIVLDVEIDEPYAGNDGTPIHYLKSNYGLYSSIDEDRNLFFCQYGIEVIRFAEEQIFRHTHTCIWFIGEFLESIRNGHEPSMPDHICVDKWSQEIASKWAYQRFRNTYVPPKYQGSISEEGQRSYEEIRSSYSPPPISSIDDITDDPPF